MKITLKFFVIIYDNRVDKSAVRYRGGSMTTKNAIRKIPKNLMALAIAGVMAMSSVTDTYAAVTDHFVTNAEILNTYMGRLDGNNIIANAQFNDTQSHWANEVISHGVALGIVPFSGNNFNPDAPVTYGDGLAFAINLIGLGSEAMQTGIDVVNNLATDILFTDFTLEEVLHFGNLELARANNIISDIMFAGLIGSALMDAYVESLGQDALRDLVQEVMDNMSEEFTEDDWNDLRDQLAEILDEETDGATTNELITRLRDLSLSEYFHTITREEMAMFTARALNEADSDILDIPNSPRDIQNFGDWQTIRPENAQYVEALVRHNIMSGRDGNFVPQGTISRGEMAQMLRNLDHLYYDLNEITRGIGTVAEMRDNQEAATLQGETWRTFFIRRYDGDVDAIQHQVTFAPTGQIVNNNVPVFKNGRVGGLETLEIDDQIEYLTYDGRVLYINVVDSEQNFSRVTARLQALDLENGTITLRDDNNVTFVYNMASGTFGIREDESRFVFMDNFPLEWDDIPFGQLVELSLINNTMTSMSFVGQPVLVTEMRGIVIENNPAFGYLTVMDNNGNIVTRFYNQNNMVVQREAYYQNQDAGPGYIAQMFPNFSWNPIETRISDLQPGDIVFMRFDDEDPETITMISAIENYTTRHGLIRNVTMNGPVASVLVQLDDGSTTWYELGQNIFITNAGRIVPNTSLQVGDRIRVLVNQAVLAPGHVMESVLEASIEAPGHHIGEILNGNLAGINNMQGSLMLQNARPLTNNGWGNHQQIQELNLSRQGEIEFYHEGQRISLDHAQRFLSRSNLYTYVAMDQAAAGASVRQITFRDGRDELLNTDTVLATGADGSFMISTIAGMISTDNGTIVRRNGRMVSGSDIMVGDLVRVSLNGGNNAAVVDIIDQPGVSAVSIARVRIASVEEGRSFTVTSMSTLQGNDWMFTPVERVFSITPNTLFLNESGWVDPATFLGFTEDSAVDRTFTVVYDGSVATHVIDNSFSNRVVRGTIYNVGENQTPSIQIRDAQYLHNPTLSPEFEWRSISNLNPVMDILTNPATIFIRNNEIVALRDLQVGDNIRVMTNGLPEEMVPGVEILGNIVLVDR